MITALEERHAREDSPRALLLFEIVAMWLFDETNRQTILGILPSVYCCLVSKYSDQVSFMTGFWHIFVALFCPVLHWLCLRHPGTCKQIRCSIPGIRIPEANSYGYGRTLGVKISTMVYNSVRHSGRKRVIAYAFPSKQNSKQTTDNRIYK